MIQGAAGSENFIKTCHTNASDLHINSAICITITSETLEKSIILFAKLAARNLLQQRIAYRACETVIAS